MAVRTDMHKCVTVMNGQSIDVFLREYMSYG